MKFGPIPVAEAEGAILGHNVADRDGRRTFRKGKPLDAEDLERLRALGRDTVYAARLEVDDVDEDEAALRVTRAVCGPGLRLSGPATGRVNLYAEALGIVRVEPQRLFELNGCEGITLATRSAHTAVVAGRMVATTKVLPYAVPEEVVARAEQIGRNGDPIVALTPLPAKRVGLLLTGSQGARERVVAGFEAALRQRITSLGSSLDELDFVPLDDDGGEERLSAALGAMLASGLDLLLVAGETAIMDRHDIAPRAIEQVGGEVVCFGAPVDPGNLLLLGYVGEVPVLGAPGCARSPKANIVDLLLPRLLAGDRLERRDIIALGHGGLLEDVPERPLPRSRI